MKNTIFNILIILIAVSCSERTNEKTSRLDIYLPKIRIESYQGVEIEKTKTDSVQIKTLKNRFGRKPIRIDTLTSELILAGAFKANKDILENEPFIKSENIVSFDKVNGKLTLDSIATLKLSKLESDSFGVQFVLVINGKPELFGYFYRSAFTYGCSTYHYMYFPGSQISELELYNGFTLKKVDLQSEHPDLFAGLK